MIPTEEEAKALWSKYRLPEYKRRHATIVAKVAAFLAKQLTINNSQLTINLPLLTAGALLHDIDKNISRLPDEKHPQTAVRVLKEEGMAEVAELVKTHPLHAILDPSIAPKTWEEKILFLADKMVKLETVTVDKRFALWRAEDLPQEAYDLLSQTYPKVKELEKEFFDLIQVKPEDLKRLSES